LNAEFSDFGIFIASMLEYNNFNFDKFADKLHISKTDLASYLNNIKFPEPQIKKEIAKLLNIKSTELNRIIQATKKKLAIINKMSNATRADINHSKFKNDLRNKIISNE